MEDALDCKVGHRYGFEGRVGHRVRHRFGFAITVGCLVGFDASLGHRFGADWRLGAGSDAGSTNLLRAASGAGRGSRRPPRETAASALCCLCFLPSCLHCLSSRGLALVLSCFRFSVALYSCVCLLLCLCECATSSRLRETRAVDRRGFLCGGGGEQGFREREDNIVESRNFASYGTTAGQWREQHLLDYWFRTCEPGRRRCELPSCGG